MNKPLIIENLTIPAGAVGKPNTAHVAVGGGFFFVMAATGPFGMQFDNGQKFIVPSSGFKFAQPFQTVTFFNETANDVIVQYALGEAGVGFDGSGEIKNAQTYNKGNLGIVTASDLTIDTNGYVKGISGFVNRGTGYVVGNVLTVNGGTGTAAKIYVQGVGPRGEITSAVVSTPGSYTVNPTNPNTPTGGSGSGAQFNFSYQKPVTGLTINGDGITLLLAAGNIATIPGFDGANRRKMIRFQCTGNGPLNVFDSSGALFAQINSGSVEAYESSDTYTIGGGTTGQNNAVQFIIGEVYYGQKPS